MHTIRCHHASARRPLQCFRLAASCIRLLSTSTQLSNHQQSSSKSLKVLFCGADAFSIYSLRALHNLQLRSPEKVSSIDVVCKPDKRVGRGLKQVREVPIKSVAAELGLPIHQINTFTGWAPPFPVDLVVTVSFGLLVPPRILSAARHGGLNVHPSMLPDLRGPAPIQHALLQDRRYTGVTLQTMHPTKFDRGQILYQTPEPGVPVPEASTPDSLVQLLGPMGAELLEQCVSDRTWVHTSSRAKAAYSSEHVSYAPKILPSDRHISWVKWQSDQVLRYDRVLRNLWDKTTFDYCLQEKTQTLRRVVFHGPWRKVAATDQVSTKVPLREPGDATLVRFADSQSWVLAIMASDSSLVSPSSATIEGETKGKGAETLAHGLRARWLK